MWVSWETRPNTETASQVTVLRQTVESVGMESPEKGLLSWSLWVAQAVTLRVDSTHGTIVSFQCPVTVTLVLKSKQGAEEEGCRVAFRPPVAAGFAAF